MILLTFTFKPGIKSNLKILFSLVILIAKFYFYFEIYKFREKKNLIQQETVNMAFTHL